MATRERRFVDLFCGLGGFHVGLTRLGHRCVFACEKDDALRTLYVANFGLEPAADIRQIPYSAIPPHDILCAGFPCQPFSKAGQQMGLQCERDGDLFSHILKILQRQRPTTIILENVSHLLRHDDSKTYAWMRCQLEQLGYAVSQKVLSPHFFGIPQIRSRAFIVGSLDGLSGFEWPSPLGFEPDIRTVLDKRQANPRLLPHNYAKCIEVWQDFLDRIPRNAALPSPIWSFEFGATYPATGAAPSKRSQRSLLRCCGSFGVPLKSVAPATRLELLPTYARGARPFPVWKQTFIQRNRHFYALHAKRLKTWLPQIRAFAPSLQKLEWNCKGEVRDIAKHLIQFRASGVRVKRSNWAPALVAMTTTQVPVVTWENRYMSVEECARLQGLGNLRLNALSPSAAYRAIGNAVSADLVQLIARALLHPRARSDVTPQSKANR